MKKIVVFGTLGMMALGMLSSCSSDPDYYVVETINVSKAQFPYNSDDVWMDNDKPGFLNIMDFEFSHIVDEFNLVYGFTPSKVSDVSEHSPLYSFPYACAAGGGVQGTGSQYLVGYWAEYLEGEDCPFESRTCRIYNEDGTSFEPQSVMVCNNTYLQYAALKGTDMSPKFVPGDYVVLIAHGVHQDGSEETVPFYLINIESSNIESGILLDWQKFDLSDLGACTGLYFTMDASENLKGEYGLNIPTYFCIDSLVVKQ